MDAVRVTAKVDYAVRAAVVLAAVDGPDPGPVKGEEIGRGQDIPTKYLESILTDLRHAGIVRSQRGADGGYWLARPADEITIADVIRAVEGPLANVRGERPEAVEYAADTAAMRDVWVATRAAMRSVLEATTLADVADGTLPARVRKLLDDPEAWEPH
jgi:Rrf2 family protein